MLLLYRYCAVIILLLSLSSSSQIVQEKMGVILGVRAGLSVSSFWGDGVTTFEKDLSESVANYKSGLHTFFTSGFFVQYEIVQDFFAIQPEFLYLRSGKSWKVFLNDGGSSSFNIYSDYLQIPFIAKILIPSRSVIINAYAGPSLLIKLSSRAENISSIPETVNIGFLGSVNADDKLSSIVNPVDAGLTTGFALDILAGSGRFLVDLRYTFGTIQVFKPKGGSDFRNSAFSLFTGYAWSY
ncbi:MAG: PorT family protein [Fibrobacter sp.]|nr:PorT family protein [Fibrobacter sp.]